MKRARKQSGMSLVELGASTIVVAVSLVGTVAAVVSGAAVSEQTVQTRAAARASSTVMEQIRAIDFAELVDRYDGKTLDLRDFDGSVENGSVSISVTEEDTGNAEQVYKVVMTVTFQGSTKGEALRIVTYVANRTEGGSLQRSRTYESNESDPFAHTDAESTASNDGGDAQNGNETTSQTANDGGGTSNTTSSTTTAEDTSSTTTTETSTTATGNGNSGNGNGNSGNGNGNSGNGKKK